MDGHKILVQRKHETEARQKAKYKAESRERLKKIAAKKIQTTMIGALDSIEKHFETFWNDDELLKEKYEIIRQEILDRGNDQIRKLNTEIDQYEVEWLRYNLKLNVRGVNRT